MAPQEIKKEVISKEVSCWRWENIGFHGWAGYFCQWGKLGCCILQIHHAQAQKGKRVGQRVENIFCTNFCLAIKYELHFTTGKLCACTRDPGSINLVVLPLPTGPRMAALAPTAPPAPQPARGELLPPEGRCLAVVLPVTWHLSGPQASPSCQGAWRCGLYFKRLHYNTQAERGGGAGWYLSSRNYSRGRSPPHRTRFWKPGAPGWS